MVLLVFYFKQNVEGILCAEHMDFYVQNTENKNRIQGVI